MAVTAKLSRNFYERFGDDAANELVDLLNQMDDSFRSELRELNDANFARFEAKLSLMASKADLLELKSSLGAEIAELRANSVTRAEFGELKVEIAGLREVLERRLGEQTRWMFAAWSALLIPMLGMILQMWKR